MKKLVETKSWQQLNNHFQKVQKIHLKEFFQDKDRAKNFSIDWQDFLFDFSKNRIDQKTIELFISLAQEINLSDRIASMFNGEKINWTEQRAVNHWALRSDLEKNFLNNSLNNFSVTEAKERLEKIKNFSNKIRQGTHLGASGKKITDIVNIGIGGSDLGPRMIHHALDSYSKKNSLHFISNVDGSQFTRVVKNLNPETTLFIIASKSFTTTETMCNANSAREWLLSHYQNKNNLSHFIDKHFVAISSNVKAAKDFGISADNVFKMWDFVGGRYSIWSSISLSICCCYGFEVFNKFLEGARSADIHFREVPFHKNIPFVMAILSIWYNNFFQWQTQAIFPYSDSLRFFPDYLQQLEMESNGKSVNSLHEKVSYQTGQILWGGAGTDGQHAYFQLLHQGTKKVPCDFISFINPHHFLREHQQQLLSNFLAQTKALAFGINEKTNLHNHFEGNVPSTSILIEKVTPQSLGKLIVFYEHKVFVQGLFWQINSFDQWGVELGKKYAKKILQQIKQKKVETNNENDSSTNLLMKKILF